MFALAPIPPHDFDRLIDRTLANRKAMKRRGQLKPLIVPSPQQRADGLWREQILIAADAVIIAAIDLLIAAGAGRQAVDGALTDLQLSIVGALNALDDGKDVELAFAHDGRHFIAVTAATVIEAMRLVVDHFTARGMTDPTDANKLAVFCVPLREAYQTVRARAVKHRVEFPERVWPTLAEFDAGADLLAAAIGSRTSPVITQWQEARTAEIEARTRRDA